MSKTSQFKNAIKVVMFDLGNVLLFFSHERMFQQIAAVLRCDAALVEQHLRAKGILHLLESGKLTNATFIDGLHSACASLGASGKTSSFAADISLAMSDIFAPNQRMIDVLLGLKVKGLKLILVSNTSAIHFEFVKARYPWLGVFDEHVLSYEIGYMKPDPAFYAAALQRAAALPKDCLFIDDIQLNVDGAAAAGLQTHQYKDHDEFLRFLSYSG